MVQVVDALQMMWLQNLHLDVRVPHLCSDVVVLIEICTLPLVVQFSHCPRLVLQPAIWLSLTRIVRVEYERFGQATPDDEVSRNCLRLFIGLE